MEKEIGSKKFPIWLLGDSNPKNWQKNLKSPLDPRHPARHNIWTPVLDVVQDRVFRESGSRINTSSIYIRNAIENPEGKPPDNCVDWEEELEREIKTFQECLHQGCLHQECPYQECLYRYPRPKLLFSFGAFSFEFARRALEPDATKRSFSYWGAKELGQEFRQRIEKFDPDKINLLPLLHVSIARGKFIESHNYFTGKDGGNYFEFTGKLIANILIKHHKQLNIWINPSPIQPVYLSKSPPLYPSQR